MKFFLFVITIVCTCCTVGGTALMGLINTRTDVQHVADIVKDIRDMSENCHIGDIIAAETIYMVGKNSPYGDKPGLRSLQNFGQETSPNITAMMNPSFAFQMYGLTGGDLDRIQDQSIISFADEYARRAFNEGECFQAVDASGIMSLWMQTSHLLWDVFLTCAADSGTGVSTENSKYYYLLDSFIAMWVGSLQSATDSLDGHSLYTVAQKADRLFRNEKSIAHANVKIMESYQDMYSYLSLTQACSADPDTAMKIWHLSNEIMSFMMVPLIQLLIHSLYEEDQSAVKMYGSMVVPQLSQCRYSTYTYLQKAILENEIDSREFKKVYNALTSTFECLNLRCEDIGIYSTNTAIKCLGDGASNKLARYPLTTKVRQVAKIDIDIHQMNMFMKFDSDIAWDLAASIYKFGKNSHLGGWSNYISAYYVDKNSEVSGNVAAVLDDDEMDDVSTISNYLYDDYVGDDLASYDDDGGFVDDYSLMDQIDDDSGNGNLNFQSLRQMATTNERLIGDYYSLFQEYFQDANYADTLIMDTFDGDGFWGEKQREVRAAIISVTLQTSVMYMEVVTEMEKAISDCETSRGIDTREWDEVAALIIGSLEGTGAGGSDDFKDGELLWNIGNKRAFEFGRANLEGYAISNERVLELLFAGKGEISKFRCDNLKNTAKKIMHYLLIPVMQSVIEYARLNEGTKSMDGDKNVAIGEAYSYAVLPMVNKYNEDAAKIIENNMLVNSIKLMVDDGPQAVADAFNMVVYDFGIECNDIGKRFNVDTCKRFVPRNKNDAVSTSLWVPCIMLTLSFAIMS